MKWIVTLFILLLAGGGAELWVLRERLEANCQAAHTLARHGPELERWLDEAFREPFLGEPALHGPPLEVMATYRSRARWLAGSLSTRWVPAPALTSLRSLGSASNGVEFARALAGLPLGLSTFTCHDPAPKAGVEEAALIRDIAGADQFWNSRKEQVVRDKAEFARDREIFCKADQTLARLRIVADAAARKCRKAKPGTKVALHCANPTSESAVEAEMQDVKQEKAVNERKLRQKWPEAVIAGLQC